MVSSGKLSRDGLSLRRAALAYPEAYEEMPPCSASAALSLPFVSPTEYGLGRSGWVTATFPRGKRVPLTVIKLWIDESYRAVAPKRLVAQLPAETATPGTHPRGRR